MTTLSAPEENNEPRLLGKKLSELVLSKSDDPNELLKHRYLCREGLLGFYGQTGIGKSSLSMQCMILWALGREAFGIKPKQPLTSLLIQAENDEGDIVEMRDGIVKGLGLNADEIKQACDKIIILHEDSKVGDTFINLVVVAALKANKPDLLWIDPALSYLGGDTISQKDVGGFLRNLLKPLLKTHQCGCVIVHHTNKSGSSDTAYSGSGSAEWGNMPRAVLTLTAKSNGLFELKASKRGSRLRWKEANGKTGVDTKHLKHSNVEGQIFWLEANVPECLAGKKSTKSQDDEDKVMAHVPAEGAIEKNELEVIVNMVEHIGLNKVSKLIKQMIEKRILFTHEVSRTNARPEIHVSRSPSKAVTGG